MGDRGWIKEILLTLMLFVHGTLKECARCGLVGIPVNPQSLFLQEDRQGYNSSVTRKKTTTNEARLALWWDRVLWVAVPLCILAFALHSLIAYDIWWQLKTGEWIMAHGIPRTDPFSYAFPDRSWIELRWLFTVLAYGLFRVGGVNLLILSKGAVLLGAFGLLGWLRPRTPTWVLVLASLLTLAAAHNRFFVRPELVTYLFLPLFLLCLFRYRQSGRVNWLFPLPLVQVVWTNSHTLFILGPVLLWLFAMGEGMLLWLRPRLPKPVNSNQLAVNRAWWQKVVVAAAFVTLACFLNPYGLQGALFPFQLLREIGQGHSFSTLIDEFRSPLAFAGWNLTFVSFILLILISGASFALNKKRMPLSLALIWAAFLYLAFLAVRNLPLFAFVAGTALILNLTDVIEDGRIAAAVQQPITWSTRLVGSIFILVMIPLLITNRYYRPGERQFGLGVTNERFPILALSFIQEHNLPGPLLHNLGDGGYVLFALGEKSVFTDGRLEVYSPEQITGAVALFQTGDELNAAADQFAINTILLRHGEDRNVLLALLENPDWVPVYYDHLHVIYLRLTPQTASLVDGLVVNWRDPQPTAAAWPGWYTPNRWSEFFPTVGEAAEATGLGQLFVTVGNLAQAQHFLEIAVAANPDDAAANLYLGVVYRALGDAIRAEQTFGRVAPVTLAQPGFHLFAADIYEKAENNAAAYQAYCEVIRLVGQWDIAVEGVKRNAAALNRPATCTQIP